MDELCVIIIAYHQGCYGVFCRYDELITLWKSGNTHCGIIAIMRSDNDDEEEDNCNDNMITIIITIIIIVTISYFNFALVTSKKKM